MKNKNILLGVNIDHAATIRQARYKNTQDGFGQVGEPDPLQIALAAEHAGADRIIVHLREDRRHIQEVDIERIHASIPTRLNLVMACTDFMIKYALKIKPHSVCLVPESKEEITTAGGLDVVGQSGRVRDAINTFKREEIDVCLSIDPNPKQIEKSAELKAPMVEFHTGAFTNSYYTNEMPHYFKQLCSGAELAHKLGLIVNAGHGIDYVNIAQIREIPWLHEVNVGHSIISRALLSGIVEAVKTMKNCMKGE